MRTAIAILGVLTTATSAALPTRNCAAPRSTSTRTCEDRGPAFGWHDSDGKEYNCRWYRNEGNCAPMGDDYRNFGLTANDACCGCGGGRIITPVEPEEPTPVEPEEPTRVEPEEPVTPVEPEEPTPVEPEEPTRVEPEEPVTPVEPEEPVAPVESEVPVVPVTPPSEVCTDKTAENGSFWHGDGGTQYDCDWYASGNRCERHGDRYENFGYTAKDACCACDGGDTVSGTSTVARREDETAPADAPTGVWSLNKSLNEAAHNTAFQSGGSKAELILRRGQTFTVQGPAAQFSLQALAEGYSGLFEVDSTESAGVSTIALPVELPIGRFYLLADGESLGTIVVLFNPWSKDDIVYMPDDEERYEYIQNPRTLYYFGDVYDYPYRLAVGGSTWQLNTGQVLDDVLDLLEYSVTDWEECGNERLEQDFADPIKVSRSMSYMGSSFAAHGLVEGRWDGEYEEGRNPSYWTGTKQVIDQWKKNNQTAIKYGQCWVFGCTLTSILRSLGIPSRVVSNFNSAHETPDGFIETAYGSEAKYDHIIVPEEVDETSTDSVWNFHVWVNTWFKRPDLDALNIGIVPHAAGWNDVDSTPQELSDGKSQMGPANHNDMLNNYVKGNQYDNRFVMSEYNAYHETYGPEYVGRYTMTQRVNNPTYCRGSVSIKSPYNLRCTNEISKNTKPAEPSNPPDVATTLGARRRSTSLFRNDKEAFEAHDYHMHAVHNTVGDDIILEIDSHHADFNMTNVIVDLKLMSVMYTGKSLGVAVEYKARKSLSDDKMVVSIPFSEYSDALGHSMDFQAIAVVRNRKIASAAPVHEELRFTMHTPVPTVQVSENNLVAVTWTNPMDKAVKDVRITINGPDGTLQEEDVAFMAIGESHTMSAAVACGFEGDNEAVISLTTNSVAFDHLQTVAFLSC